MKITIKNLKIAKFASEETLCFEATVYVDGKRSFTASNDGHGACNFYHGNRANINAAEVWAKYQPDGLLDYIIDELIEEVEITREVKKIRRKLAISVDGQILVWKCKPENEAGRAFIAKRHPDAIIFNDVSMEEAIALYRAAA
jgi:hypothetical protein